MENSGKSIINNNTKLLNPWMLHFQKLALELKCPLCLNSFKKPVLLPCNHLFCSSCLADSTSIRSECALCNTKCSQKDIRHLPFVENIVTIYKSLDATFCANAFQQRSSDNMRVLEQCQTLYNSACCNKKVDKVLQNSCMSNEAGVGKNLQSGIKMNGKAKEVEMSCKRGGDNHIAEKPDSMNLNQATQSEPDSPPFCDTKGSDNGCSDQNSEKPLSLGRSESSSLKRSSTTGKGNLKERMPHFWSESSASENEDLTRDLKRQKNLTNEDGIVQQSTSYHNKLVDSCCDLEIKSDKDTGVLVPSNAPSDLYPSTSICSFCQSSKISEATGSMLHYASGISVTGEAAMEPNVVHVHKVCIDWAPQVYFVGETVKNLKAEVARGAKLKCTKCGKKGAALGCYVKSCRRTYHVPCAMDISACRWDHVDYLLLCPSHSNVKFPNEKSNLNKQATQKHPVSSHLPSQQSNQLGAFQDDGKKMVFCGSALSNEEKVLLINFASKVGATVSKCWTSDVTHVIAATDANGACSRTLKVLRAILNGQWILKVDWIRACMKAMNLVEEELYEIDLDNQGCQGGPKAGRLRALANEPKLFSGLKFYFSGEYDSSYKKYLEDLVEGGGGVVLKSKDDLEVGRDANLLAVYNLDPPEGCELEDEVSILWQRLTEAENLTANTAGHTWILESIAACKLQPFVS